MNATGKVYRGQLLGYSGFVEGELIWYGKTPTIRGWCFVPPELPLCFKNTPFEVSFDDFGTYEVEPDSLELVDGADMQMLTNHFYDIVDMILKRYGWTFEGGARCGLFAPHFSTDSP